MKQVLYDKFFLVMMIPILTDPHFGRPPGSGSVLKLMWIQDLILLLTILSFRYLYNCSVADPEWFIPDPDPALNYPSSGAGFRPRFRFYADPDPTQCVCFLFPVNVFFTVETSNIVIVNSQIFFLLNILWGGLISNFVQKCDNSGSSIAVKTGFVCQCWVPEQLVEVSLDDITRYTGTYLVVSSYLIFFLMTILLWCLLISSYVVF